MASSPPATVSTGWTHWLTRAGMAALAFLTLSGLAITFGPFHPAIQWSVLVHTAVGVATLVPLVVYLWRHWKDYRAIATSDVVLLGYLATAAVVVCLVSGVVVAWQGAFGIRMSPWWRNVHLGSTFVAVAATVPHLALVVVRALSRAVSPPLRGVVVATLVGSLAGAVLTGLLAWRYAGPTYVNAFPEDYSFVYGEDRPFAPSLARTTTGGAFDQRSLAGSETCGSAGCHVQIVEEWRPSAHRYAAMDVLFQGIQNVMAEQNGPESTRYCGGCHDPISLFSGSKNLYTEELTGAAGYQEGVSCLGCHAIRETDLQGNANYVIAQPREYLWQWAEGGVEQRLRDFLIRTYPDEHNTLSKRMFKAPEYCAACHKQFIDEEVNNVGWVQLQNQFDNWKASHWYHEGEPQLTIECRECHMPLVASTDPAAGDAADYNRTPHDGMHRSHRFIAANALIPELMKLPGWEEQVRQTQQWLAGDFEIPEIADKWATGPVVTLTLETPSQVHPGDEVPIRVVLGANKVGHDFPTGPLDIIQSWVELEVTDDSGHLVFASGRRDEANFIEPGSFLFKAEPIDQQGNLIDRHNLWEMVGVRYRRALFPGYTDTVGYTVTCPGTLSTDPGVEGPAAKTHTVAVPEAGAGTLHVTAILHYRKVDQFLLNYLLGEDSGVTAPVMEMTRATATIGVAPPRSAQVVEPVGAAPATGD